MNMMTKLRAAPYEKLGYAEKQAHDRARFLRDTRGHRMTIIQDDGLHRHIQCWKPGTGDYHFNITTFPGYLVFTGDVGSYVFSRLRDMFEFHRINWDQGTPKIDYRYWAQKCTATARDGGTKEFNEAHFKEAAIREFWNHDWPDHKTRRDQWTCHIRDIISDDHQNSGEATRAMMDYRYHRYSEYDWGGSKTEDVNPFHDFYEHGPFTQPSFSLKWACWAIAHTIRDYDLGGDKFARQMKADKIVLGAT